MTPRDQLPYIEWAPPSGGTERIYADAWEHEAFASPALITDHAVENGSHITDHIRPEPKTFACRMFFSGSPIRGDLDDTNPGRQTPGKLQIPDGPSRLPLGTTNAINAGLSAVGFGPSAVPDSVEVLQFQSAPDRLRTIVDKLIALQAAGVLFAVGSTIGRRENMGIENIETARGPDDGDSGGVDISFKQVTFSSTQAAAALPLALEPRVQPKKTAAPGAAADVPAGPKKTAGAAIWDAAKAGL